MAKLEWDKTGERIYETGVDHGVLFVMNDNGEYGKGIPWNGLTSIQESPEGAEENAQYADNMKYLSLYSSEEYKATIEALTYPDEFEACDGTAEIAPGVYIGQQNRKGFALYYRTKIGDDVKGDARGYKHHIVYNLKASPSERQHETVNDSPEPLAFSWEVSATKVVVDGYNPTATFTLTDDGTKSDSAVKQIVAMIEGSESEDSTLPSPSQIIGIVKGGVGG